MCLHRIIKDIPETVKFYPVACIYLQALGPIFKVVIFTNVRNISNVMAFKVAEITKSMGLSTS
jgi:hypothetical protein